MRKVRKNKLVSAWKTKREKQNKTKQIRTEEKKKKNENACIE